MRFFEDESTIYIISGAKMRQFLIDDHNLLKGGHIVEAKVKNLNDTIIKLTSAQISIIKLIPIVQGEQDRMVMKMNGMAVKEYGCADITYYAKDKQTAKRIVRNIIYGETKRMPTLTTYYKVQYINALKILNRKVWRKIGQKRKGL